MKFKLHSDQFIQTDTARDCIATKNLRTTVPHAELQTKILIRFFLEESDLPFVPFLMVEVPVSGDPLAGHAFDLVQFDRSVAPGRSSVVAHVVVPDGNKQMEELKIDGNHGGRIV